jgi:hypothetical protein
MQKEELEQEVIRLKSHIKNLQIAVGRWKRMAKDKDPKPEFLKERHDHDIHFIDVIVSGIPADTELHEAQRHMLATIIPEYSKKQYRYHACYRSRKYGWVCTLSKPDDEVDMSYSPQNTYELRESILDFEE